MAEIAGLPSVQALAQALAHFLWQGALIALSATLLFRASGRASTRYAIGIGALVAMVVTPVVTFLALLGPVSAMTIETAAVQSLAQPGVNAASAASPAAVEDGAVAGSSAWAAAGVFAWIAGMLMLSIRLAGGWLVARRMATRAVRPAAEHVQAVARSLGERLAIGRAVQVLESSAVAVPVLIGWLRPAVVFPVAALAGLSPVQIEALLAHELAHVRRHDYFVNLLQSFAEIVLFYHPAVWWLARRIRNERELCCDDLAVGLCDRLVYATALTDLAAMRSSGVALAATGGDLLTRVRRILGGEEIPMSSKVRWIPALVVSGAVLVAVPALVASARSTEAPVVPATAAVEPLLKVEGLQASTIAMADYQSTEQRERARQQVEERAREVRAREERARQAEIEKANSELLRVRQLVERGLASREQLIEAEKARAMAEGGRDEQRRAIVEWEAAARRFENLRALRELGLVNRDELARAENGLARLRAGSDEQKIAEALFAESIKEFERAKTLTDRGLMPKEQLRELEERFRQVQEQDRHRFERAEERMKQLYEELRPRREELEAVPSREIAAGDTLFISIEGESQLPTIYRIEGNGTIRVPLLGAFKVTGQTPGQVREAIGKKLMDSKLGSPAKVRVELRQPREERRVR